MTLELHRSYFVISEFFVTSPWTRYCSMILIDNCLNYRCGNSHNENIMPQLLVIHYMFIDILIHYTAVILTYELHLFDALCNCINMPVLSVFSVICML